MLPVVPPHVPSFDTAAVEVADAEVLDERMVEDWLLVRVEEETLALGEAVEDARLEELEARVELELETRVDVELEARVEEELETREELELDARLELLLVTRVEEELEVRVEELEDRVEELDERVEELVRETELELELEEPQDPKRDWQPSPQ